MRVLASREAVPVACAVAEESRSVGGRSGRVFETVDIGGMFAHEIARLSTPILAHPPARALPFLYFEGPLALGCDRLRAGGGAPNARHRVFQTSAS